MTLGGLKGGTAGPQCPQIAYERKLRYRDYPIVLIRLSRIGRRQLAEVLEEAWRQVAPKRMRAAYDARHLRTPKPRAT